MSLALVRDLRSVRPTPTDEDLDAFEQDLVAGFVLARSAAGVEDGSIQAEIRAVSEFRDSMGRHLWTARPDDADRFLGERCRGQSHSTLSGKAFGVSVFFEYLELRHHAEIHTLTGDLVQCPIDEMNRPRDGWKLNIRIPPSDAEIAKFFDGWRDHVATTRKFLPAARNYTAAKLWSQVGLRIGESTRLDMADLKWELGPLGKVHVRFGKGSRRRGPKQRIVPLINGARDQAVWFVEEVRGQFDDAWDQPGAPFLVSERRAADGSCGRVSTETLRAGLARAVERHLPSWQGRLSPHVLRHYCASSLYRNGVDIVAIQELLGHEWVATTMGYIHVHNSHIEDSWERAADRSAARLGGVRP
ncbi:site-specific integrase [Streptomyces sp. ISL-98]|uniref:tyrosine-type recombinase/integrase n=1 Tax=Streptomyces sp. ISL-98 TaxID=2819192 RepID=UPI001BE73E89|nr:site-specific integrase [Streptomyces sp. ISL-98]MBT2511666.1 site-specific integrase [Streptomyces sp. ISL-98]